VVVASEPVKARTSVSDDQVLLRIAVRDELSTWLKLVTVEISVDGKKAVSRADANGIDATTTKELYTAPVVPGSHTVTAKLVYKGRSAGVFSYMEGYTFRLSDSTTVIAGATPEGGAAQTAKLTIVGADRGATNEFEKRPLMRFER
jgi:hypothetical protein